MIKPILFNTDMVRAILDGRKTVTRRVVKVPPYYPHFYKLHDNADGALSGTKNRLYAGFYNNEKIFYIYGKKHVDAVYYQAPYQPGDILYVRETWGISNLVYDDKIAYIVYKASENEKDEGCRAVRLPDDKFEKLYDSMAENNPDWHPSIHMPKEAARIWLKVKDVRVERLQEIDEEQARKEGCQGTFVGDGSCMGSGWDVSPVDELSKIWNSTIKKSDIDCYGWGANPWVWVIEFERCEKPEEF